MGRREIRTPEEIRQQAVAAAHQSWANTTDPAARLAPALEGQQARFRRLADPDGVLSEEERERRAYHIQAAHMAKMRAASLRSRREKKAAQARRLAEIAEAEMLLREYGDAVSR